MHRIPRFLATILLLGFAPVAQAQEQVNSPDVAKPGTRRLTLADFSQFSPVSALDMVERIPGFSIQGGDGRRGFGDNAGNVLIDGDRPSTKTDDIFTLLSRIPASQVDFVELTESGGGDGEARGKSQIVNVVRKKGSKASGTYEASMTVGEHHGLVPTGKGSISLRRGATTFEVNAGYFKEDIRGRGPEVFRDGRRNLIETRLYNGHGSYEQVDLGNENQCQHETDVEQRI
jgi:hypothetical protein